MIPRHAGSKSLTRTSAKRLWEQHYGIRMPRIRIQYTRTILWRLIGGRRVSCRGGSWKAVERQCKISNLMSWLGEPREFANHLLDQFIGDRYKKMARPHMCRSISLSPDHLLSIVPINREVLLVSTQHQPTDASHQSFVIWSFIQSTAVVGLVGS